MDKIKLEGLISKKIARQAILNDRKEQLEQLERDLFSSKIGRFLGNMGYYIKRYVALFLGILAVVFAITIFVYPNIIYGEAEGSDLLMKYKADYYEIAGKTIDESIRGEERMASLSAPVDNTALVVNINNSIQKTMESEILLRYKYMAVVLLVLGFLLLYISKMTKSIHTRNLKIVQAEILAKEVISDYKLTIAEEAEELQIFRSLGDVKVTDVLSKE